jgi:hypothetical protein
VDQILGSGTDPVARSLTGTVFVPGLGRQIPEQQFSSGVPDHRRGVAAPFSASLFTNAAATAGRAVVAVDERAVAGTGLGYRGVVVQASDGMQPYELAMFESALSVDPTRASESTRILSVADRPETLPGEDMVF